MSAYDDKIKPKFEFIYKQLAAGRSQKEVFYALNIPSTRWYDYKKEHREFALLIQRARDEYFDDLVKTRSALLEARPPEGNIVNKLLADLDNPETSVNDKIQIYKLLYPESDWFRGVKIYEAETRRILAERDPSEQVTDTKVGNDVINMLSKAIDPNKFKE